jgi:hypothetical protein
LNNEWSLNGYLAALGKELEAISKMSFGPISLLVPRFPALRDDPSNLILFVGLKSSIRRRRI